MKRLYYIQTSEYDIVASIDEEDEVRYLVNDDDFPEEPDSYSAEEFLESIEDDSEWDNDIDEGQLYDMISTEDVLAEIEKDI